jgi:hypothetical protein
MTVFTDRSGARHPSVGSLSDGYGSRDWATWLRLGRNWSRRSRCWFVAAFFLAARNCYNRCGDPCDHLSTMSFGHGTDSSSRVGGELGRRGRDQIRRL